MISTLLFVQTPPLAGDARKINMLWDFWVSGAKVRAVVEILLAPTRGGSIQAECDHGARDIWPVAWRAAGAFAEAPGQSDGA